MPTVERIQSDAKIPSTADVVVIGGGIVGAATAYYLGKQGTSVALLEKGFVGAEQSSRNWGWCRQQNRDEREIPLAQLSLRLWGELSAETGRDLGFRRTGIVFATEKKSDMTDWLAWSAIGHRNQVVHQILTAAEAKEKTPGAVGDWIGGVYCPTDGRAEPAWAAPRLALAARDRGATIHQNCAARGLELSGGRVSAVITEQGLIRTSVVLCAGGAWASMFCHRHNVRFPQAGVRSTAFATTPAPIVTDGNTFTPKVSIRRREDGGYTVGMPGRARLDVSPQGLRFIREFMPLFKKRWPLLSFRIGSGFFSGPEALSNWSFDQKSPFEHTRVLDPPPVRSLAEEGFAELRRVFPQLAGVKVAESWGGFVDLTPDSVPVISEVDTIPGFYLAAGFSGHGFGVGPGAGQLAATLISDHRPAVDPEPFRLSRLARGARLEVPELI